MMVVPAIDLVRGRCIRLAQGDFERETLYSDDPAAALKQFVGAGAQEIHVVDLDGARAAAPMQHKLVARLAQTSSARLQVAGGFRTADQVDAALGRGVHRVVIGSLAISYPNSVLAMLRQFGAEHLGVALDVKVEGERAIVASHGWTKSSGLELFDVLTRLAGIKHVLVTDISRDGMLMGPNVTLMAVVAERFPHIELQASGGVRDVKDLAALRQIGAARAIVGKAIWEGRIKVAEAFANAGG